MHPRNLQREAIEKEMRQSFEEGKTEPKADPPQTFRDGDKWRCHACRQDVFGVVKDGVLEVKYRERLMEVDAPEGRVRARCRNCGQLNVLNMSAINVSLKQIMPADATEGAIKLAEEHGILLESIEGSGKDGRVVVKDVQAIVDEREAEQKARVVSVREYPVRDVERPGIEPTGARNPPAPGAEFTDADAEQIVEIDEE